MLEAVAALVIATAALLGSPGPATLSLAAVAATSGITRGMPYYAGIISGLLFAILGAIVGLATVLTRWPQVSLVLQVLGASYILYVAWKIATAPVAKDVDGNDVRPPGFRDGFILNILNVKAYAAILAILSQFLLPFDDLVMPTRCPQQFALASRWLWISCGSRRAPSSKRYFANLDLPGSPALCSGS